MGKFTSNQAITLENLTLPEFLSNRTYDSIEARILPGTCRYDMILGRDALRKFGLSLDFDENKVFLEDIEQPMRPMLQHTDPLLSLAEILYIDTLDDDLELDTDFAFNEDTSQSDAGNNDTSVSHNKDTETAYNDDSTQSDTGNDESFATHRGYKTPASQIQINKYDSMDIPKIINNCTHLTEEQRAQLISLLQNFPQLFDGVLRSYPDLKMHLDIDASVPPRTTRAYTVPMSQLALFKAELNRLIKAGALEKGTRSAWISGTFIVPKKDGKARWVSDFRALNTAIRRKVYPLPRTQDILRRRKNYRYLTKIDLSMCYYTYELDDESKDLCTIATPFGLYRYKRLPQGISQGPDIAQELIEKTMEGIDGIECYIDDVAIFSDTWDSHLETLNKVLERLQAHGCAINPSKCEWGVQETDFLGHYLTPEGMRPWSKKVRAILDMKAPRNLKELRAFIGLVNYYRDMWPGRAHALAPLTALTGRQFRWTAIENDAFQKMKAIITGDALLAYPDHNLPFVIETDASDYQLGAIIKQNNRPIAHYSRKLTSAQRNYTTIEKELLSVVETLREFRSMLLGATIDMHTDHRNLTYKLTKYNTQRVLRWRLLLEEFHPNFHYKKGSTNTIADALSRIPTGRIERSSANETLPIILGPDAINLLEIDHQLAECLSHHPGFPALTDCHFQIPAHPTLKDKPFPFEMPALAAMQKTDAGLKQRKNRNPKACGTRLIGGTAVQVHLNDEASGQWRIAVPDIMLKPMIHWYHENTCHTEGHNRLYNTMSKYFHHPALQATVRSIVKPCKTCKRMRKGQRQYGHLAPRDAPLQPWSEVHLDSIGPWEVKVNRHKLVFNALTCLEPCFNLLEIAPQLDKTSAECAKLFQDCWLSRYPRPMRVVHDNGPEFKKDFQQFLRDARMKSVPCNPRTPTSNGLLEATHKAIGIVVRTLAAEHSPRSLVEANNLIRRALATAMHASRCASNESLGGYSPGSLAFGRDMILNIPLVADIITLQQFRQARIDERVLRANSKRIPHDYAVGEKVYVQKAFGPGDKAKPVCAGPFTITRVHTNNNVTVEVRPGVTDRFSMRRIKPDV